MAMAEKTAAGAALVLAGGMLLAVLGLLYAAMNSGRSALAILLTFPFALTGGAFALLVAGVALMFLLIRPEGLFGEKIIRRI